MSRSPYKFSTVRVDDDESGKNVAPYATVQARNAIGAPADIYFQQSGGSSASSFILDANGEKQIWAAPGIYSFSVAGGDFFTVLIAPESSVIVSAERAKGAWNASTNTPALTSGTGAAGDYYEVSVAGNTNLDGNTGWLVGDRALFNGASWSKLPQASFVRGPSSSINDQLAFFDGPTGKLLKAGQTIAQYFASYLDAFLVTLYNVFPRQIEAFSVLSSTSAIVGQRVSTKGHTQPGIGALAFVAKAGSVANNGGTRCNSATPNVYWDAVVPDGGFTIFHFGGQRGADIKAALQAAVDASPSTHDITTFYTYEPSWKIRIPYGNYLLSERVLITKNNIIIEGDGMFNTNIYSTSNSTGKPIQSEMIRFRGAYACGIKNLTLDGGLPFNLASAPDYGCRIPLVLDQVAHLDMDGVNVCNYRTRGIQCIHVWEGKFGEIRIFNGWGLDDALGIAPGGLVFDGFSKEENFFPGAESNQIYIAKYAFSGVGSIVRWGAPCFNVVIEQGVFEGRTYSGYQPSNMDVSKFYISGFSANCGIQHAWVYFHDQPFNTPAVLIEAFNAGPGCYFDNINLYQENAAPGVHFMELQKLLNSSSAFPVRVNLNIHDIATNTALFDSAAAGSLYTGDIFYRNDSPRTLENFVGALGQSNFNGTVTMSAGAFGAFVPQVYNFKSLAIDVSAIDGLGLYPEYKCRAWVKFDGATGAIIGTPRNVSSVIRNSAGDYSITFSNFMPDNNSVAFTSSNASATGAERAYIGNLTATGANVINAAGTVKADAAVMHFALFR